MSSQYSLDNDVLILEDLCHKQWNTMNIYSNISKVNFAQGSGNQFPNNLYIYQQKIAEKYMINTLVTNHVSSFWLFLEKSRYSNSCIDSVLKFTKFTLSNSDVPDFIW